MIKLWSVFPPTPSDDEGVVPREYRKLLINRLPDMPECTSLEVTKGRAYLADNYIFIDDEGRGQTHVFGLQAVQLRFQ